VQNKEARRAKAQRLSVKFLKTKSSKEHARKDSIWEHEKASAKTKKKKECAQLMR
jgi:hypothetical protein